MQQLEDQFHFLKWKGTDQSSYHVMWTVVQADISSHFHQPLARMSLKDQIPSIITISPFTLSSSIPASPTASSRSVHVAVTTLLDYLATTEETSGVPFPDYQDNASFAMEQPENFVFFPNADNLNFSFNDSGINNRTFDNGDATIELITMIVTAMLLGFIILATVIGEELLDFNCVKFDLMISYFIPFVNIIKAQKNVSAEI